MGAIERFITIKLITVIIIINIIILIIIAIAIITIAIPTVVGEGCYIGILHSFVGRLEPFLNFGNPLKHFLQSEVAFPVFHFFIFW